MAGRTTRARGPSSPQQEIEILELPMKTYRKKKLGRNKARTQNAAETVEDVVEEPATKLIPENMDEKLKAAGITIDGMDETEKRNILMVIEQSEADAGPSNMASTSAARQNSQDNPYSIPDSDTSGDDRPVTNDIHQRSYGAQHRDNEQSPEKTNDQLDICPLEKASEDECITVDTSQDDGEASDSEILASSPFRSQRDVRTTRPTDDEANNENGGRDSVVKRQRDEGSNNSDGEAVAEKSSIIQRDIMEVGEDDETQPPDDQGYSPCGLNLEASTMAPQTDDELESEQEDDEKTAGGLETQEYNLHLSVSGLESATDQHNSQDVNAEHHEGFSTANIKSSQPVCGVVLDSNSQPEQSYKSRDHRISGKESYVVADKPDLATASTSSHGVTSNPRDDLSQGQFSQGRFPGDGQRLAGPKPRGMIKLVARLPELTLKEWDPRLKEADEQTKLVRHYRGMQIQQKEYVCFYGPEKMTIAESDAYTKRLMSELDNYRLKLKQAQRTLPDKLPWGESVKVGQHINNTLDVKGRGRQTFDINAFMLDVDSEQTSIEARNVGTSTDRQGRNSRNGRQKQYTVDDDNDDDSDFQFESLKQRPGSSRSMRKESSDSDLPDLIIESDAGAYRTRSSSRGARLARRNEQTSALEPVMETNHETSVRGSSVHDVYDIMADTTDHNEEQEEEKYFTATKLNLPKIQPVEPVLVMKGTPICEASAMKVTAADKEKTTRKRKLYSNSAAVLAPETQNYEDQIEEAIRRSKQDMVIGETQIQDDDYEYLTIDQTDGRVKNINKRMEMATYNIPKKVPHSKAHRKILVEGLEEYNEAEINADNVDDEVKKNQNSGKDHDDTSGNSNWLTSSAGKKNTKANVAGNIKKSNIDHSRPAFKPAKTQADVNRVARKRKHKEPVVTLVEDTQDLDEEVVETLSIKMKTQRKPKRKTFILTESSSDEESIAETQNPDIEISPDVVCKKRRYDGGEEEETDANKERLPSESVTPSNRESLGCRMIRSIKKFLPSGKSDNSPTNTDSASEVMSLKRKTGSDEENDNVEDSQSPVIKKKTHRHMNLSRTSPVFDRSEEPVSLQNFVGSSSQQGRRLVNLEGVTVSKGVKKLFSRPVSNESNISEASATSSQQSVTMFNESGDLYCTQMPNMSRKRRAKQDRPAVTLNKAQAASIENNNDDDIVCLDESDEEISVNITSTQKSYSKKKLSRVNPVLQSFMNAKAAQKSELKHKQSSQVSQYFVKDSDKALVYEQLDTTDIDLNNDLNQSKHRLPSIDHESLAMTEIHTARDGSRLTLNPLVEPGDTDSPVQRKRAGFVPNIHLDESDGEEVHHQTGPESKRGKTTEPIMEKVPCPICYDEYSPSVIERHAADCTGKPQPPETEVTAIDLEEEGGKKRCFFCDQLVQVDDKFQAHVEHCRQLAEKQQEEIEKAGYGKVFQKHNHAVIEPRVTRAVLRSPDDSAGLTRRPLQTTQLGGGGQGVNTAGMRGRRRAPATATVTTATTSREDEGYIAGRKSDVSNEGSTDASSWSSGSESSSDDENISLSAMVRTGSNALVTGSWNKRLNQSVLENQENQSPGCKTIPHWMNNNLNSPIKTFVPISQQEDSTYFTNQFSYKKDKVLDKMKKRKQQSSGGRRRTKRRKIKRPRRKRRT